MRTTTGTTGRRGDACMGELSKFLARAQRTCARLSEYTERELDRLDTKEAKTDDDVERGKALRALIEQNRVALLRLLDIEARLALKTDALAAQAIDLEDARAEIERRLARLAA